MATLTGKKVQDTYKDLLQVSNSNSGVDATMRAVEDGEGTATLLYLSTAGVAVNTGLNIGAATAVTGGKVTQTAALSAATGNEIAYSLAYTTNKSGSGDDTGLQIVQTDTASPGTSLLIDAKVATASKFTLDNAGTVTFGAVKPIADNTHDIGVSGSLRFKDLWLTGLVSTTGVQPPTGATGDNIWIRTSADIRLGPSIPIVWATTSVASGVDAGLSRAAAGVVKVTDGSTGAGTITAGGLQTGAYTAVADGKAIINATLNDDTGDEVAHKIAYTTNKATSGADTGLEIVQTDTASPGTSYLINAKVATTSKFYLTNDGLIRLPGVGTHHISGDIRLQDLYCAAGGVDGAQKWVIYAQTTPPQLVGVTTAEYRWSSDSSFNGTPDLGMKKGAAGVLQITNGLTGIGRISFEPEKRQFGTHKTPGTAATVTEYGGAPTHTLTGTASNVSDATGHYVQLSGDGAAAGIDLAATECCKTEIDPVVTFIIKTGAALPTDAGERIWVGLASASLAASDSPSGIHVAAFRYAIDTDNTAFWRCVTNDGGADAGTATITTSAIATGTRYRLTIDATDSASIKFFVNGTLAATHTTNLPTATQALGTTCLTVDAGASTQEILISKIHYETT